MAIAQRFNERAALVDAIFDHMLTAAGSSFPVGVSFYTQNLADALGVDYTEGKPGYGPKFEKVFNQDWSQLVQACASWLSAEDFLIEWSSGDRMIANTYRLSERGARLMGCLPPCLDKQPGDDKL